MTISTESFATESSSSYQSFDDQSSIPSSLADQPSFQVPSLICDNRIKFTDAEQNLKISIDCLAEHASLKELQSHRMRCKVRNQNHAFQKSHQHETAKMIWDSMKSADLAAALIKVINEDLTSQSLAQHGITKLRSDVAVKNCDLFALKNSSTLHCVKKKEKNSERRGKDLIQLNSADIRLISGNGQSINKIKAMVTHIRKQNIPTEKGVVSKIRSERQNIKKMTENIIVQDVQRRSKNQTLGQSHLGMVNRNIFP